jgi:F-type H+-transporting ATPase subunit delta
MIHVKLKIAQPYDDEVIAHIRAGFTKTLGYAVDLAVEEDESLIGGFLAYANGKVYDASLRTKLMEMRRNLSD